MVRVIDHGERPAKRVLTIEQALRWAYRDELPKARPDGSHNVGKLASGWAAMTKFALYGTEIDENPYGVLHDASAVGAPHPDALRIAAQVDALAGVVLELTDDWQPFRDLGELGAPGEAARLRAIEQVSIVALDAQGRAVRQLRAEPRRLIIRSAALRDAPDWSAERPLVRYETAANGRPKWFVRNVRWVEEGGRQVQREIEVDGYNARAQRPYADAYRKTYLDPDPAQAAIWRAEWQVWVTALELLTIDLEDQLESIDVRPCGRSLTPWEDPASLGRVLPDLNAPALRAMTLSRGHWAAFETLQDKPRGAA